MAEQPDWYYRQSGVIPFRKKSGEIDVLLITSRKKKHWIVPKGVVEKSMTKAESAAAEAFEEAGVRGKVLDPPLGSYQFSKWDGTCTVTVFPMAVEKELKDWPEKAFRSRQWVSLKEAAVKVHLPQLAEIILALKDRLGEKGK